MHAARVLIVGWLLLFQAACGEGRQEKKRDTERPSGSRALDSSIPAHALDPSSITGAQLALGDSIFQGKAAGGICWTCHGTDAKGRLTIAPDLTDSLWLHSDGSYPAIIATIAAGVPKPKESSSPMPPGGGTPFSHEQLRAVAAYVYSLSHPEVATRRP